MKQKLKIWLDLFITFFKIGLFSFGGGYGMIFLVEREVVTKHKWLTADEMLTILAVAESTPGPISINTATYVGEKRGGMLGGIFATFGVVLPSFVIIFAISFVFEAVKDNIYIMYAFKGIRVAVVILIFNAFVQFLKRMDKNVFSYIIMISIFLLTVFTPVSTIYYLLIAATLGIIYFTIENIIKKKRGLLTDDANALLDKSFDAKANGENVQNEGEKDADDCAECSESNKNPLCDSVEPPISPIDIVDDKELRKEQKGEDDANRVDSEEVAK